MSNRQCPAYLSELLQNRATWVQDPTVKRSFLCQSYKRVTSGGRRNSGSLSVELRLESVFQTFYT